MNGMREQEAVRSQRGLAGIPEWWTTVPQGERALLQSLGRLLRSAKRSRRPDVARAAAKWERGIGFFVKVRLMREQRRLPAASPAQIMPVKRA